MGQLELLDTSLGFEGQDEQPLLKMLVVVNERE